MVTWQRDGIVLAQFEGSRWIAVLLSGDGSPEREPVLTPPKRFGRMTSAVTEP